MYKAREILEHRFSKLAIASVLLSLFFIALITLVPILGKNIPVVQIQWDYLKGGVWALILLVMTVFLPARENERISLIMLWCLRCTITLGFMLVYEYIYSLDAYFYFSSAIDKTIFVGESAAELTGTHTTINLATFFADYLPFSDSYHAMKVMWSFFGFLGSYFFYCAYTQYTGESNLKLLWVLNIFPSIVFWSSIFGKDPITYVLIALFFFCSVKMLKSFQLLYAVPAALALYGMTFLRSWLVIIFASSFLITLLLNSKTKVAHKVVLGGLCAVLLSFAVDKTSFFVNLENLNKAEVVGTLSKISSSWSRGGSAQEVPAFTNVSEMVQFMPRGMFAALFRPLPGEVGSLFGQLAGIENFFILLAFFLCLFKINSTIGRDIFIRYSIITVLVWAAFYGFISYQNLGSAARFRLQVLPILILIPIHILYLYNKNKDTMDEQKENSL